jgi:hypothetical protein
MLSIHAVYHVYGIEPLPESLIKTVSLALVSLLGILRMLRVVKAGILELSDAGKKK